MFSQLRYSLVQCFHCSKTEPHVVWLHGLLQHIQTSQYLGEQFSYSIPSFNVFKENKVDGKILVTLSRADLTDLFPADFITRKKLWDFICNMVSL